MGAHQIIKTPEGSELVILERKEYDALIEALAEAEEDLADLAIYHQRKVELLADPTQILPAEVSAFILKGMRSRTAIRTWRGMSPGELSKRTDIDELLLAEIEQGQKPCPPDMADRLAKALEVPVSWFED